MTAKPMFKGELMFASNYVCSEELKGRDVNVTIDRVEKAKLRTTDGKMEDKFLLHFKGAGKPLVLNKTNASTIAMLHGPAADKWPGKRITLFPTTCQSFGKTATCIRVRDKSPDDKSTPAESLPGFDGAPQVDHHCPECGTVAVHAVGSRPTCDGCGGPLLEGAP